MDPCLLIFHIRGARRRARAVAVSEVLSLLAGCQARLREGGPLADQGGVFWLELPATQVDQALERLPWLGYANAVDLLDGPLSGRHARAERGVRWHGQVYRLLRVYEEDAEAQRAQAVDRRVFLLQDTHGQLRQVRGYRGDGGPLSRRGLPTCDARMLVNLVRPPIGTVLLDPFAGTGGIVLAAAHSGLRALSCDNDPALYHGLLALAAEHHLADARRLPFADASVDAIATEPPYDRQAELALLQAMAELCRVLRPAGRLALLCAAWQAPGLRRCAEQLGLRALLDAPLDRKGTACHVLAWEREQ